MVVTIISPEHRDALSSAFGMLPERVLEIVRVHCLYLNVSESLLLIYKYVKRQRESEREREREIEAFHLCSHLLTPYNY